MKLQRTKNTVRNLVWGLINRVVAQVVPFITRTVFINILGIEYLGLNSLFTSILNVLSLAELGVGTAMVYHMYRAIASDDNEKICALMSLYRKWYRIIGLIVLGIGLLVLPILRFLIGSEVPGDVNIYILYLLYLAQTVITYFLFAYKNSILNAYQRQDVISKISSLISILLNLLQIVLLIFFKNYYVYVSLMLALNILNNIVTAIVVSKMYPQYSPKGTVDIETRKDMTKKIKALFVQRAGMTLSNSADPIIISSFLGLTISGIYNNYFIIITLLFSFITVYTNSILAGLGNNAATETLNKNNNDFYILFFVLCWIVGWMSVCLMCLYQHFMRVWMGDELLLSDTSVILLVICFYFWKIQDIVTTYKDAVALWEVDKYRSFIGAIFNLSLNIILVKFTNLGINGVIVATITSTLLFGVLWSTLIFFKHYLKCSPLKYFLKMFFNCLVTVAITVITYFICYFINDHGIGWFILKCAICLVVPNILFFLVYFKTPIFKQLMTKIKAFISRQKQEKQVAKSEETEGADN